MHAISNSVTAPEKKTPIIVPVVMLVITAIAIASALWGAGLFGGTDTSEIAGGALDSDATPLAPASSAFRIWSVIYVGLILYTLWQFAPSARTSVRQQKVRPWALASIVLNSVWLWVTQLDLLVLSVFVIAALLAVLVWILVLLTRRKADGWVELVLYDGVFGLYAGWVLAATFANLWAVLVESGVEFAEEPVGGVVGIVVLAAISVIGAIAMNGRIAPSLSVAWALAWVAVARTEGQFESELLWSSAAVAAVVVVLVPAVLTVRNVGERVRARKAGD